MTGQFEDCSDSKGVQKGLNGRALKYNFWGGRFHMFLQSYECSHGLCLDNFLQVLLIVNQIDWVPPFRYINRGGDVSHSVLGRKILWYMKCLIS